jgi:hypothetical protein
LVPCFLDLIANDLELALLLLGSFSFHLGTAGKSWPRLSMRRLRGMVLLRANFYFHCGSVFSTARRPVTSGSMT